MKYFIFALLSLALFSCTTAPYCPAPEAQKNMNSGASTTVPTLDKIVRKPASASSFESCVVNCVENHTNNNVRSNSNERCPSLEQMRANPDMYVPSHCGVSAPN
jgi:hypothetical protein